MAGVIGWSYKDAWKPEKLKNMTLSRLAAALQGSSFCETARRASRVRCDRNPTGISG